MEKQKGIIIKLYPWGKDNFHEGTIFYFMKNNCEINPEQKNNNLFNNNHSTNDTQQHYNPQAKVRQSQDSNDKSLEHYHPPKSC